MANTDVFFCIFLCFQKPWGRKMQIFDVQKLIFEAFGGRLLEASRASFGGLLGFPSGFWGSGHENDENL